MLMFNAIAKIIYFMVLTAVGVYLATLAVNHMTLAVNAQTCERIGQVHDTPTTTVDENCYFVSDDLTLYPVPK